MILESAPARAERAVPSSPELATDRRLHLVLLTGYSMLVDLGGSGRWMGPVPRVSPFGPTLQVLWDSARRPGRASLVYGGRLSHYVGEEAVIVEGVFSVGVQLVRRRRSRFFLLPGVGFINVTGNTAIQSAAGTRTSAVYSLGFELTIPSYHGLELALLGAINVLPRFRIPFINIGLDIFLGIGIGYRPPPRSSRAR